MRANQNLDCAIPAGIPEMAIVTVQLGQCGNQIGTQLYSTVLQDALEARKAGHHGYWEVSCERFFDSNPQTTALRPRTVLIDMEQKVIQQSLEHSRKMKLWEYDSKCIYSQKRGSGNNWANGYCCYGPAIEEDVMSMVHRQVERCDHLGGFLVLMSVAGGTGSGVGAHITEALRGEFPHAFLVNQVVWPYASGEVIVQDYNTLLTLSHIYDTSDGVLAVQNDHLQQICSRLLKLKNVSFADMNKVICHGLASILQPAVSREAPGISEVPAVKADHLSMSLWHIGDLVSHLTSHPQYRLLSLMNIPQTPEASQMYTRYLWPGLLKHLRQMMLTSAAMDEGMDWTVKLDPPLWGGEVKKPPLRKGTSSHSRCTGAALFLRGLEAEGVDASQFAHPELFPPWSQPPSSLRVAFHPHHFNKYEKSAALVVNGRAILDPLGRVCSRGWAKFNARAYLHQYSKYGLGETDFVNAFVKMEHVLTLYNCL